MFINSDFSDLLRLFNDNGVRYLVIGGYAVTQHTEPRFTKDLDLWISTDASNAAAVYMTEYHAWVVENGRFSHPYRR